MRLYDTKAIATFLDLSERRVRQLRDKGIIHEQRAGLYDLTETNHAYINYLRKRNPESTENIDYNTERALLVRAKRKNEEYDLAIKDGRLHDAEEIRLVMQTMLLNFKSRMMAIPSKVSPILSKKTDKSEIFNILKSNVDEALNELADFDTAFSDVLADNEAEGTAHEAENA